MKRKILVNWSIEFARYLKGTVANLAIQRIFMRYKTKNAVALFKVYDRMLNSSAALHNVWPHS